MKGSHACSYCKRCGDALHTEISLCTGIWVHVVHSAMIHRWYYCASTFADEEIEASNTSSCLSEALDCFFGAVCASPYSVHNSVCDQSNNIALCLFDGGDCCSSSCESSTSIFTGSIPQSCIGNEFDCVDPTQLDFGLCDLVDAFPYIIEKQATKDAIDAVNLCGGFPGSEECVFDQITQARHP